MPADLPAAWADERRVRQVALNLMNNAVKYSPGGSTIRVSAAVVGDALEVRVVDEGEGIPPDKLEEVFEPFRQVDMTYRGAQRGTGLGLAICRGLIGLHGGRIWAESAGRGQGSSFCFTLPIAATVSQAAAPGTDRVDDPAA
jgi:signal transduction histidine kinase